jgi:uncharacterized tellurite resistance protein B-like protein
MLRALQELFTSISTPASADPAAQQHQLHLATAVLLVEVMRADPAIEPSERQTVVAALRGRFKLTEDELARLVEVAETRSQSANDFFAFTSTINDHFSHPDKVRMIEHMWEVAFADGHLDAHENHLISKVAGLLHVTHGEYIAAKLHAKDSAQKKSGP